MDIFKSIIDSSIYYFLFGSGGVLIILVTIVFGIKKEKSKKQFISHIKGKHIKIEKNRKSTDVISEEYEKYEFKSDKYYKEFIRIMESSLKDNEFVAYNQDKMYFSRIKTIYDNLIILCNEFDIEIDRKILEYGVKNSQIINKIIVQYITDDKIVAELIFGIDYDMIPFSFRDVKKEKEKAFVQDLKRYLIHMKKSLNVNKVKLSFGYIKRTLDNPDLVEYIGVIKEEKFKREFTIQPEDLKEIKIKFRN